MFSKQNSQNDAFKSEIMAFLCLDSPVAVYSTQNMYSQWKQYHLQGEESYFLGEKGVKKNLGYYSGLWPPKQPPYINICHIYGIQILCEGSN